MLFAYPFKRYKRMRMKIQNKIKKERDMEITKWCMSNVTNIRVRGYILNVKPLNHSLTHSLTPTMTRSHPAGTYCQGKGHGE